MRIFTRDMGTGMNEKKHISVILEETKKYYTIKRANTIRKEDMVSFLKQAYADQFNAADYKNDSDISARWDWANVKNPNIERVGFPAWVCKSKENEEIAGHLGVIPVSIKIKDGSYKAVWGRDMIAPPKWRKKGVASFLFTTAMEETRDSAALFLLGGANDYAVAIYKKLGFVHLGYIPLYVRAVSFNTVLRKFIGNKFLRDLLELLSRTMINVFYMFFKLISPTGRKSLRMIEITGFDSTFDVLWSKVSPLFPIIVSRDSKSLTWRFIEQPYWNYRIFKAESNESGELKGYIVLREGISRGLHMGIISDIFASPQDSITISSLIQFAVKYFGNNKNIDLIRCDILCERFESILKKSGFIKVRSKSHFLAGNIDDRLDSAFILNRNNWFINYADSDLDLSGQKLKNGK